MASFSLPPSASNSGGSSPSGNGNGEMSPDNTNSPGHNDKDLNWYLPLYRAILEDNWDNVSRFFQHDPDAIKAGFGAWKKTALHIAVGRGCHIKFVEKLLDLMPSEAVALPDSDGYTALFDAAMAGNIEVVKLLVRKNPNLPNTWNNTYQMVPLHVAITYEHKDVVLYLLTVTTDDVDPSPFAGLSGQKLVNQLIVKGFHDVAVYLIQRYPGLTVFTETTNPLMILTKRPSAFPSGIRLNIWQRLLYEWCQEVHPLFWKLIGRLVPEINYIQEEKMKHAQTLQLVKCLCTKAITLEFSRTHSIFAAAVISSVTNEIPEIIEQIVDVFPHSLWVLDSMRENIFRIAIRNRSQKIYNLIYQVGDHRQFMARPVDCFNNNILHFTARLPLQPQQKLASNNAALRMLRELQWYKEVEKTVPPSFNEMENLAKKTPKMIFAEEHKSLAKEGKEWMEDKASSYKLVAALIAVIVFVAAATIPGNRNGDNSIPSLKENAFKIFAVSDILSLFSSIASMMLFLSILSARYAEGDFLHFLPSILIFGLVNLLVSITSMMIAFSAGVYLVLGKQVAWIVILVGASICLPVALFVIWQVPLLVELVYYTYGPRIFSNQSNRVLY